MTGDLYFWIVAAYGMLLPLLVYLAVTSEERRKLIALVYTVLMVVFGGIILMAPLTHATAPAWWFWEFNALQVLIVSALVYTVFILLSRSEGRIRYLGITGMAVALLFMVVSLLLSMQELS